MNLIAPEFSLEDVRPSLEISLNALNPAQREAVQVFGQPLLVLAGAGSGKTRVLTTKLGLILREQGVAPFQILAVTFTNKAAQEMRHRLHQLTGIALERLWLGTFHSIAAKILRRHAESLGYTSQFTILDTDDQLRLIRQLSKQKGLDDKKYPPKLILHVISRWKDRGLLPDQLGTIQKGGRNPQDDVLALFYQTYQAHLKTLNAMDFGDLILGCVTLFKQHGDILDQYRDQFRYILVDEYQDINVCQYLWLRLLAKDNPNICFVGDDDQSIYGWRGAEVENMLRFEKDFPSGKVIRLEENYRSTPHILGAAASLIAKNRRRLGKTLKTNKGEGEKVTVKGLWTDLEEASWIAQEIMSCHHQHQVAFSDIAILVRASFQTRAFEEAFVQRGIPYRMVGGLRFYERQEIRDVLAYLRVIDNIDNSLAFERMLNTPKRGLGASTLQALQEVAAFEGISLFKAAQQVIQSGHLRSGAKTTLHYLITKIEQWQKEAKDLTCAQLAAKVMEESGYLAFWKQETSLEAEGKLENLKELVKALEEFESLQVFLEHVSLVTDTLSSSQDGTFVSLMTLHTAKGLEFERVFLPGWEENLFPHVRAINETGENGLEEERRLAYVGLTRAKTKATVTFARSRRVHNQQQACQPSRFIQEMDPAHVQSMDATAAQSFSSSPRWSQAQTSTHNFRKNQRVFHAKFGYGTVLDVEGEYVHVSFETGVKTIVSRFLKASPL